MTPSEILAETIRRDADGAPPVRNITRKQLKAWSARDETKIAAFLASPRKTKR
jgi:hypothetical protein